MNDEHYIDKPLEHQIARARKCIQPVPRQMFIIMGIMGQVAKTGNPTKIVLFHLTLGQQYTIAAEGCS